MPTRFLHGRRALTIVLLGAASTAVGQSPGTGGPVSATRAVASITVSSVAQLEAALRSARNGGPKHIVLTKGRYELSAPILIDERLSGTPDVPLTISAASEGVVLSGAKHLSTSGWHPAGNGVWRARVARGLTFQRLWLGDRLLVRARYPNFDPAARILGGVAADATAPERVRRWRNPSGAVLHAIDSRRWGGLHVPILGKNPDGTLRFGPSTGNNRAGSPSETERYVENVFEELDAPDEWFYDAAGGWLYFKTSDGSRPPESGFRASAIESLVRIEGKSSPVHDVRIIGLSLRDTEPTFLKATEPLLRSDWKFDRMGAVLIEKAARVEIADSNFTNLGGNAIVVSGRAHAVRVHRNLISGIGGTAIAFVGRPAAVRSPLFNYDLSQPLEAIDRTPGPKSDDYPSDSEAVDNLIHDIGVIDKQAAGVQLAMSARIRVDHNTIYRVPRAGINVNDGTWGGHVITNNDVFDTVLETGDHGAFNSWGRDRYWDPDRKEMDRRVATDRSLVALDARETIVIRHNRFRCDHGWDIDLDDGSSNYLIENNLLLAGGLKFREGFDRVARNNIILNNTFHPHVWFPGSRDVFEHNIVMAGYQPILMSYWGNRIDYNLLPSAADLDQARGYGLDAHSVAGAPKFISPSTGDFSVAAASPALKLGFRNFSMTDFGVRPDRLRALASKPEIPEPILQIASGQGEVARLFLGMSIKSVETLGEQSAAGLPSKEGVMVLAVEPGTAADKAGLKVGDVIVAIDGSKEVPGQKTLTAAALVAAAQGRKWQGQAGLVVVRNQRNQVLTLELK